MKITDTISVNPSKTALGHVDTPAKTLFRTSIIGGEAHSRPVDLLRILFPSCAIGNKELRKYEVPLRTVFATILIVTGITLIENSLSLSIAIPTICFGAILALGLFTRPVMLGAAVFYCIEGALSIRYGHFNLNVLSLMFGCLIFAVMGGGKYSCDTLIRNLIFRHKSKISPKYKEDFLGYKAFHRVRY